MTKHLISKGFIEAALHLPLDTDPFPKRRPPACKQYKHFDQLQVIADFEGHSRLLRRLKVDADKVNK
jgi:hypothetical protein